MKAIKVIAIFSAMFISNTLVYAQSAVPCRDATRECVVSAANAYLEALVSHDASGVPFADNAERWENGVNTGMSGAEIREGLENDYRFKVIQGVRNVTWVVDGEQAIAYYLLDAVMPKTDIHTATTRIAERFTIKNGKIEQIEAIFCSSLGMTPEAEKIADKNPPSILCNRSLV